MSHNELMFTLLLIASLQNAAKSSDLNFDNKLINYKVPTKFAHIQEN